MHAYIVSPNIAWAYARGYRHPLEGSDRALARAGMVPMGAIRGLHRHSGLTVAMGQEATSVDTWANTTTQEHPLGTIAVSRDGRVYRYCNVGAADLVAGNVIQSAAPIPNHLALTSAVQAIGDGIAPNPILVTPGNTAGAANLYAEGTLTIETTPGNGYNYNISGHAAITASTLFNLYLDPDDRLQVALTASSRYGLHHHPFKAVIQTPTTLTGALAGVAPTIISATNYGWLQTRGPAPVLINGTPGVGVLVMNGATTAGSADVVTTTNLVTSNIVGRMMQVGVSTKNNAVFLTID